MLEGDVRTSEISRPEPVSFPLAIGFGLAFSPGLGVGLGVRLSLPHYLVHERPVVVPDIIPWDGGDDCFFRNRIFEKKFISSAGPTLHQKFVARLSDAPQALHFVVPSAPSGPDAHDFDAHASLNLMAGARLQSCFVVARESDEGTVVSHVRY